MRTIKSCSHDYTVEKFSDMEAALASVPKSDRAHFLIDRRLVDISSMALSRLLPADRVVAIEASEEQKSFEALTPVFLRLLEGGLKRDATLVVIGGGVLQDIGCFISSVLARGIRWELIPTTLLAQADSCIGSKSSINIGSYKNLVGTFYPPHRVLLVPSVLATLPWDELRSGLGEIIKLQLLSSEADFRELMHDLATFDGQPALLAKWVERSMDVKQPYIEADEHDRGIRNLLNYGHTFGHAFESATHYQIPHGIAVTLGMLTATYLSMRLKFIPDFYYAELMDCLMKWHAPFGAVLKAAPRDFVFRAIKHDKKNTGNRVNCILTRGTGRMEKHAVSFEEELVPAVNHFIDNELVRH